jgi:hypothetical protein
MYNPRAHHFVYSLPPEGAECRGSKPADAGLDGTKSRRVSRRRDLQGQACPWGGPAGGLTC